jgi:hypothetical protein
MSEKKSPAPVAKATRNVDRKSSAGTTPDPWEACVRLEYGGDRSFAWSVREEIISTPPEGRARAEERLLKALALPGCTDAGRQFLCQMLVLVGSAKSVPPLAPLLRDAKSAEAARYALELIPGPEASAALRDALGALTGKSKAGLIGSIAVRGDTSARAALTALKDNAAEPAIVREAATRGLDRLATAKA